MSDDAETLIQKAIEEWAVIAGGPHADEDGASVTLAHYIAVRLKDAR